MGKNMEITNRMMETLNSVEKMLNQAGGRIASINEISAGAGMDCPCAEILIAFDGQQFAGI